MTTAPATVNPSRLYAEASVLICYRNDLTYVYHHLGAYTGHSSRAPCSGACPFMQSTKFELAINLQARSRIARLKAGSRIGKVLLLRRGAARRKQR